MPQLILDTERFFEPWLDTFAGRILVPHPSDLIVDIDALIVLAPRLSQGEQVAAGCWWECVMASPAPWIQAPFTKLSRVDFPTLARIGSLVTAMRGRLDPTYHEGEPSRDDRT